MNNTSKEISNKEQRFCPLCDKREYRNECSYGKATWDKTSIKDEEYSMVRSELENVIKSAKKLKNIVGKGEGNLEAWVQSKITKAADYIDTAADYLESGEKIKEEISLVEKILGEEKCGKGMYWCNTDKVCKPLPEGMEVPGQKIKPTEVGTPSGVGVSGPKKSCNHTEKGKSCSVHGTDQCPMSEEKDPKGPVKSYKSPEELAKKHGVSVEEIKKQLEIGTKVELEHTTSKSSARITALQHLGEKPDYYTKLKKMETQKESNTHIPEQTLVDKILGEILEASTSGDDDLGDWWRKSSGTNPKTGKKVPGWVQLGGKFAGAPCAKQPGQTTKPKCGSSKMASEMSPEEEKKAAARKRREDPNPDRKGAAINVKTESKIHESHKEIASGKKKDSEGYMSRNELDTINKAVVSLKKNIKKGDTQLPAWVQSKITKAADYIDTAADYLDSDEMSEGKKDACYTKVKSRYSVWPSAYASGALVKCRKVGAANWGNKTNEDVTIEDLEGNTFAEVIDLIKPEPITGFKSQVKEATRLQAQTGNNIFVTLSWRGKYYTLQLFFPQSKLPSRLDISDEIQKIYPGSKVVTYRVADFKPGEPIVYAYKGGNAGKLGSNKNYVKPMGEEREIQPPRERVGALTNIDVPQSEREKARQRTLNKAAAKRKEREMKEEVEISESKKSEMPCNKPKAQAVGDSKTGKSHVVKACEGGKEKLIRFGQRGVKGSPKKEGESDEYASRRNRFKTRHAKNIAKGKMSAAYWANRVKW